jgi:hypothetical protein
MNTADQKAEFVKDLLSLANTKASGRRWMIIGFDDKTRSYYGPPDSSLTQNQLEQILSRLTSPVIDVQYQVIDYRSGKIGKLEILRNPTKRPYSVVLSIGDKKRVNAGDLRSSRLASRKTNSRRTYRIANGKVTSLDTYS